MAITVHFGGQLASSKNLDDLFAFVIYYATEKDWFFFELKDDPQAELEPWEHGIILQTDMRIDSIFLYFDDSLILEAFCKTQFGGVEAHLEVIEFLHSIEKFFKDFWVDDGGDYWTTNDEFLLKNKMDMMAKILDDVEKSIKDQKDENKWKYN